MYCYSPWNKSSFSFFKPAATTHSLMSSVDELTSAPPQVIKFKFFFAWNNENFRSTSCYNLTCFRFYHYKPALTDSHVSSLDETSAPPEVIKFWFLHACLSNKHNLQVVLFQFVLWCIWCNSVCCGVLPDGNFVETFSNLSQLSISAQLILKAALVLLQSCFCMQLLFMYQLLIGRHTPAEPPADF